MTVKDKAVIVTGGASGMGRASALLLAANGAYRKLWDDQSQKPHGKAGQAGDDSDDED